jgi:hypothetical protein
MRRQFHHPDCSVLVVAGYAQFVAPDLIFERFIQAVITRKDLRGGVRPINPVRLTVTHDCDFSFLSDQGTGKPADQFQ